MGFSGAASPRRSEIILAKTLYTSGSTPRHRLYPCVYGDNARHPRGAMMSILALPPPPLLLLLFFFFFFLFPFINFSLSCHSLPPTVVVNSDQHLGRKAGSPLRLVPSFLSRETLQPFLSLVARERGLRRARNFFLFYMSIAVGRPGKAKQKQSAYVAAARRCTHHIFISDCPSPQKETPGTCISRIHLVLYTMHHIYSTLYASFMGVI